MILVDSYTKQSYLYIGGNEFLMSTQDADYNLLESVVREIGGDDAVKVAGLLDPKEETTDEAIAAGASLSII